MQRLKHFAEWYLDVPSAEAGQGTAWNVSYRTPWPVWMPDWLVLLLGVALLALIVWLYLRDAHSAARPIRAILIVLRAATVLVIVALLSEATLSIDRTGLPVVALLIDNSASMGLEDQFADPAERAAAEELMRDTEQKGASRLNLAKALLTRNDFEMLRRLQRQNRLRIYRFADDVGSLAETGNDSASGIDEVAAAIATIAPDGQQTRPAPAIRKVLDDLRGSPPTAIIVLSDGVTTTTDADRLTTASEDAAAQLVPIFTVGIGSAQPARDLQLYDVLVDEVAFVNDPVSFSARLKTYGHAGKSVSIRLRDSGSDEVLAAEQVTTGAEGEAVQVELIYTPPAAGEFDYALEVVPIEGETNLDNNSEVRHVSVREERIRVLLADSRPRYEFRYLKHLLERDRTIELHTILQEADVEYTSEDRTAIDHFPVRKEELNQYDVIILGDVNPSFLSAAMLENLSAFVRESGGGLIAIAGQQFNPQSYRGTPLEQLLPIQLSGAAPADVGTQEGFHPELTVAGREQTTIFRFSDSETDSQKIWDELPPLFWLFPAPQLKAGAIVFAEFSPPDSTSPLPVIAMQRYGSGKVLFHATDELWRWRFRVGDQYYARYWVQAIRYLSRTKLLGSDRAAELVADRSVYPRGETLHLRVRFLDPRLTPSDPDGVTVMLERPGAAPRPVKLTATPSSPDVFEAHVSDLAAGAYHAWIVAPTFREAPPATDFRVEEPFHELQQRGLDRVELAETANRTHGMYFSLAEAQGLPAAIPAGRPAVLESQSPISLWNRWELLVLFAFLLLAEWVLRKRYRLI